ncbi:MAG: metallophosphoesterase [Prevotella sp.]|jgi:hypothetical protein|nr:metallophosphoesterase [Prevotella sp.]MCI1281897.1 metallophosphoesterase [Prevotella sp.]
MENQISRRSFMKRLAAVGVLLSTASLPTFAKDKTSAFSKRGCFERLSVGYATIHIGLQKPFSIMHISDTHLSEAYPYENEKKQTLKNSRTMTFGGRQEEALRDSLQWAKSHVDYIVHTGDLIDWQSEENFDLVKKYFGTNIFGTMGNHEFSSDMWLSEPKEGFTEAYKEQSHDVLSKVFPFDISFHSQVVNGVNFIGLDDVYGTVTRRQTELFKKEIKRGLPIILCMHVPFYTDDIWRATQRYWGNGKKQILGEKIKPVDDYLKQQTDSTTKEFIDYLKQEPLLKGILAGHEHINVQDKFSETATQYVVGGNFFFCAQEIMFI